MKLFIAVPSPGDLRAETAAGLVALAVALERGGLPFVLSQYHCFDIAESRNRLSARFLADPEATHLLFVDADMAFMPPAVQRLIDFGAPLAGAVYPRRQISLASLVAAARAEPGRDAEAVIARTLDHVLFNASFEDEPTPRGTRDGFLRVNGIGMGLALIARAVFETMVETGVAPPVGHRRGDADRVHDFFGFAYSADGSQRYSEDISFCRRWVLGCGGEVWADPASDVGHVGTQEYRGTLLQAHQE